MTDSDGVGRSVFDADVLRELLCRLETTDVGELNIVSGTSRVYVRRAIGQHPTGDPPLIGQAKVRHGVPVIAPLTGVYYSRPEPTSAPFVSPGDRVEAGQIVAVIETMKLFNEVSTEVSGEVASVVVQDGDLIETGQAIMFIEPGEESEHAPPHGLL
jgi:acetyl-CoA carboxylase biotin carboxyl carrier protein